MNEAIKRCTETPLWVPAAFTAWGVLLWFISGRKMWRDPVGEIRKMAEARAKSRLLHPRGGGDVEQELERLWPTRWIAPIVAVFYAVGVIGLWASALWC